MMNNRLAPFVKSIMKKDEIDRKTKEFRSDLDTLKAEALLKIEELENEDYKNVLVLRYFQFMTWDDIASKLYVVRRTVLRVSREGISLNNNIDIESFWGYTWRLYIHFMVKFI